MCNFVRHSLISLLLIAAASATRAAAPKDVVSKTSPPFVSGFVTSVAIDSSGNQYVSGDFVGTVDFNPGKGTDFKTSAGQTDAFVSRFNADGSYAWTQTFGGTQTDGADRGTGGIAVSGSTVYVFGDFTSSDAKVGGTGPMVSSGGAVAAFVLALDSTTGAARTGFGVANSGVQFLTSANARGIAVSGTAIYATGNFFGTNSRIGGTGPTVAAQGSSDCYVIALDAATGAAQTSFGLGSSGIQTFGGALSDVGFGIAASATTVYVTGSFSSSDAKIGGTGTAFGSVGTADAFVIALNATTGAAVTSFGRSSSGIQTFGGNNEDLGLSAVVNGSTVYVAGYFLSGNAQLGGVGAIYSSKGNRDVLVLALDAVTGAGTAGFGVSGNGVQTFGGSGFDTGYAIASNGGTIYVAGFFGSFGAQIGNSGPSVDTHPDQITSQDLFVLALNPTTGAGQATFGVSGSGIQTFGGSFTDEAFGVAANGSTVYASGFSISQDASIGGVGKFASTDFSSILVPLDAQTGAFATGNRAVSIALSNSTILETSPIGTTVGTFSTVTLQTGGAFTYALVPGPDGDDNALFSVNGATLTTAATFNAAVKSDFTIRVRSTDQNGFIAERAFTIALFLQLNSGVPNLSNQGGVTAVTNPTDGLTINVQSSSSGTIQLAIDVNSLLRSPFGVITDFSDLQGRSDTVAGFVPRHTFLNRGIFVAKSTATEIATGVRVGMGRKTLVVSVKETGEILPGNLGPTPSNAIVTKTIKGKFNFGETKADVVSFSGSIMLPTGFDAGQTHELSFAVGNIVVDTTVDAKGKATAVTNMLVLKSLKIAYKIKKGVLAAGGELALVNAQFSATGLVRAGFNTEGIDPASKDVRPGKSAPRSIQVGVLLDGVPYESAAPVTFGLSKNSDFGTLQGRR